ncbi:DJ-1/PfpI/YhbO family deglycase/protease [Streptomyces sp. ISL-94]|nr:DJ-1/PfpI/YhbO family deglycase/protease [Streptomyces sp. ISL-94]
MRIAFLTAREGVEEVELTEPWKAVEGAGWNPQLVSTEAGQVQAFHHLDRAGRFTVDHILAGDTSEAFDALVLPGGVANPDALRMNERAVGFTRSFFTEGKPVAAICHAPWMLVEAGVVRGRTLTSWPSLATDIRNAGGTWVDEPVRVCRAAPSTLITSRKPDDLDAFGAAVVREFDRHMRRDDPQDTDDTLIGYRVEASDGHIGTVDRHSPEAGRDHLVVDTGPWIFGRHVLVPVDVVGRVDTGNRTVHLSATKAEVKDSPDFESGRHEDDVAAIRLIEQYYANRHM